MSLVPPCSCLCAIYWSQVLSPEWRCSWSSAERWCSNYIWVVNSFVAYWGALYIRDLTVSVVEWEFKLLTHWGWNKMATIIQTIFSNAFFFNENTYISLKTSLKFRKVQINNYPAFVQIMIRCCPGDKPLSEPLMVSLLMHICVT